MSFADVLGLTTFNYIKVSFIATRGIPIHDLTVVLGLVAKLRDRAIHAMVIWANRIACRVLTLSSAKWREMAGLCLLNSCCSS